LILLNAFKTESIKKLELKNILDEAKINMPQDSLGDRK
jgi:hypothetical protein